MARPSPGRVSGMVKESPDRLEYEVALYREVTSRSGEALTPRQAVPIGSKLQLRANINAQSSKHLRNALANFVSLPAVLFTRGYQNVKKKKGWGGEGE